MATKDEEKKRKKVSLNIFLLKKPEGDVSKKFWSKREFLAKPLDRNGKPTQIDTDEYSLGARGVFGILYVRRPLTESTPEWISFIAPQINRSARLDGLKNKSVSALLVTTVKERQFAIAFGHGRHMLDAKCIETRFGIRVALNSISPDKIASIDRQTFEATPRISRTQALRATSVAEYGINEQQDLLRGLVGFTLDDYREDLGEVLAGMDSLKASVGIDLPQLKKVLEITLKRSLARDYRKTDNGQAGAFAWVDNLEAVDRSDVIEELDKILWGSFDREDFSAMWLAIPEIINWEEVTGFCYTRAELESSIHSALDIRDLKNSLRSDATLDTLRHRAIHMVLASGLPPKIYSTYKCLYAEVNYNKALYVLNAGKWYRIESSFKNKVEKYFADLARCAFGKPFVEYEHDDEGKYNEAVAANLPRKYAMLDRKLISFGGKSSKIEVCDLYAIDSTRTGKNRFIHVKRGRSSATLSHLFAQGLVSSTLLVSEPGFVAEVNKQLVKQNFAKLPAKPVGSRYEVVFAIIDGPSGAKLDLPFFSKVNLRICGKTLQNYGFTVSLLHIPESAKFLAEVRKRKIKRQASRKVVAKTPVRRINRAGKT
ncbi:MULTISPECIES: DUF6119 family protein [unclassified Burkholderia]|uniref:DUF6119 family protein n=1 Tax=unclassified Burkholderia TaxID=2613784 RepID=UPI00141D9BCC|nr:MULTISPECIES: DUF6119 family protein [unclassified Burkholderia]NIE84463.1 hypothetical protein [Burkholderia sp. Tr-860]NIF63147.1 hypothetical protein [Burkholderia sp. Cy-647]NIF97998.1 hypothetical protein [Burkholderia sp. Ax-1720]